MPWLAELIPRFSLRVVLVAIAVIAAVFGALIHPSPFIANLVINVVYVAILVAACLAIRFPRPIRSFWLGFLVTTAGILFLHKLSASHHVTDDVFTRQLVSFIDDALPEIVTNGDPNTTVYFRYDNSRRPVYYRHFDENGIRSKSGFLTMEEARKVNLFTDGKTLADLPHLDHQPADSSRRRLLPFCLAVVAGLLGGLLAFKPPPLKSSNE